MNPDFSSNSQSNTQNYDFPAAVVLPATLVKDDSKQHVVDDDILVQIPSSNVLVDQETVQPEEQRTRISAPAPIVEQAPPSRKFYVTRRGRKRPVKPHKSHLPDHVLEFKENRQAVTAVSTWTGVGVGMLTLGPIGAVIGGLTAYSATKSIGKRRERKLLKRHYGISKDQSFVIGTRVQETNELM